MIKFLLIVLLLLCLLVYFAIKNQERLLFFPQKLAESHVFSFPKSFEEIRLATPDDNSLLSAVLFSADTPVTNGVILYFHGNGGDIQGWGQTAELYTKAGYKILYYDYRGYGKSTGSIQSQQQLFQDGQLFYDYLKSNYSEDQIILMGTSMGTGIATQLAINNEPKALVLHAPFSSLEELIKEKVPFMPNQFIHYRFRNDLVFPKLNCAIALFHGQRDQLIPHQHSERLYELNSDSELHILPGVGHNNFLCCTGISNKNSRILTGPG